MLGKTVSHYRIIERLGQGGMGEVFLAQDESLDRKVALKCLPLKLQEDPTAHKRFLREARSAAALDHPFICTIHEVCEFEGQDFIVMEHVEGQTLQERLHEGPIPKRECLVIAVEIAEALEQAHDKGIIHRDVKPSNIMLTDRGHVKVMDFGLAKQTQKSGDAAAQENTLTALTEGGSTPGTMAYMSPEQLRGQAVDARSDIFSFGLLLYEMLTGAHPFRKSIPMDTAACILNKEPAPLSDRIEKPTGLLQKIVSRMLAKDLSQRYSNIGEVRADLHWLVMQLDQTESGNVPGGVKNLRRIFGKPAFLIAASVVGAVLIYLISAGIVHNRRVRWARDAALPEIARLAVSEEYVKALDLAVEAERYLANDPDLTRHWANISRGISIDSTPEGADVSYRPFGQAGYPWRRLAKTPIRDARIPLGSLEWRISKPGYATVQDVGLLAPYLTIRDRAPQVPHVYVLEAPDRLPPGMVRVSTRGPQLLAIAGLEHVPAFEIDDFRIDRYEVTNRDFKRFVDAGGYREPRYWRQPFSKDGRTLAWEEATAFFRDSTGRPGPATWELGAYPEGKDEEPVGGVSWFEAAAYAAFAGKELPTIFHWSVVADRRATSEVLLRLGRFHADGPLPVGASGAQSRFGTYDLAGNVKEWCWNEAGGGRRYTLGGGWSDPAYFYNDADGRSPWERGPSLGFRCMQAIPGHASIENLWKPVEFIFRDFSGERPVSDDVFKAYAALYSYDRGDLAAAAESVDESPRDWRHEVVTINAAYGNERLPLHLLLPKRAVSPFQTLVYFPGINALHSRSSSEGLERLQSLTDFVIRSGRAIVMPVYKGTHERMSELRSDFPATTTLYRDHVVMWSKDLQRTVDYLLTRPDIAHDKIGFAGRSWGGAMGTIMVATEPRLKLAIFYVGGFYFQRARPEAEAINFAPRVHVPSLMLNGRFDFFFPVETSQRPMFELIGVPKSDKRWVVYDTSHALPRAETMKETLAWLDMYFGPVPQ